MSNDLEMTKISGAILLAGLIAMLCGFVAKKVYFDHDEEKRGFQIEVAEEGTAGKKKEEVLDLGALLLAADVEAGAKIAKGKCVSCHSFEQGGKHGTGPNLYGVLGLEKAHHGDYAYSKTLAAMEGKWTVENLYAFLNNPKKYAKGTKMSFAGLRKPKDLANMIAYLKSNGSEGVKFPDPLPVVEEVIDAVEEAVEDVKGAAGAIKEAIPAQ